MSATMARQGGRVQLEQSDMHLVLNMAKMAKEGFSRAAIEETKYLIKKPRAKVREEKKRGVEFPGHKKVKAAIQRHPAQPLTPPGLNRLKSSICPPDIRIRIQLFPVRTCSKMMRIPSTIPILIQI